MISQEMSSGSEIVVDQGDVTPSQQLKLQNLNIEVHKRADHHRYGPYRWGYYCLTEEVAHSVGIPKEYWSYAM